MLRIFIFLSSLSVAHAVTCAQIKTIYQESSCCSDDANVPCVQEIPSCSESGVDFGQVCLENGKIFVKGLNDAFDFSNANHITLKKHIIPDTNGAYDLGNAENKIRYLFKTA